MSNWWRFSWKSRTTLYIMERWPLWGSRGVNMTDFFQGVQHVFCAKFMLKNNMEIKYTKTWIKFWIDLPKGRAQNFSRAHNVWERIFFFIKVCQKKGSSVIIFCKLCTPLYIYVSTNIFLSLLFLSRRGVERVQLPLGKDFERVYKMWSARKLQIIF